MLVAKYKRSDSDNEDGEDSGSRPSKPVTSSVDDAKPSASTSYSSSTLPSSHRSLSIAPYIPDYQIAAQEDGKRIAREAAGQNVGVMAMHAPHVGPRRGFGADQGAMNTFNGRVEEDATDERMFEEERRKFEKSGRGLDPGGQFEIQKKRRVYGEKKEIRGAGTEHEEGTEAGDSSGTALGSTPIDASGMDSDVSRSKKKKNKKKRGRGEGQEEEGEDGDQERDEAKDPSKVASFLGTWADLSKRKRAPTREEEEEERKKKEEEEAKRRKDGTAAEEGEDEDTGASKSPASGTPSFFAGGNKNKRQKIDEESIWHGTEAERNGIAQKGSSSSSTSSPASLSWITPPSSLVAAWNSKIEIKDSQIDQDLLKLLMANEGADSSSSPSSRPVASSSSSSAASSALALTQKFSAGSQNFIPKKAIHTWSESEKALSTCRFIPKYGHLLLCASMDSCLRIYETSGKKRCLMTYKGHHQSIREMDWSPHGDRFVTASYDRMVRLWDAETGKTIGKFDGKAVPFCAKFYPENPSIFLVGQSNRKIVQWDERSGEIVQEYNRHLGSVNSITFIDQNRRFVTSSDDKSVRVWDFDVPVDIKYIADPKMHSMPCITMHPNGKYFLCQGLDNKIHVFSTREKFPANHKKKFTGHLVSGYACNISVSPDGRCVTSGDSSGNIFFWDWKTSKLLKKIKAHSKTVIDVQWHPLETSRVASAGWDNLVKLWD